MIKDAGDDPDVTDKAEVVATLRIRSDGAGIRFVAGEGVGTVTRAGLPIPPGEPAINPVPRQMMTETLEAEAIRTGLGLDLDVEIAIPGGAELALRTLNPRLGIVGGLSILGTTGIVIPYSCSSWIHSIHRGVDVARAAGLDAHRSLHRQHVGTHGPGALRPARAWPCSTWATSLAARSNISSASPCRG